MRARALPTLLLAATLLACGGDEPAEETPAPAPNPVEERVAPTRDAAAEAEKEMQARQNEMEAQAREAAGDTAAKAP